MYRVFICCFFSVLCACPAFGQLPAFYKNVRRVAWVVKDLDRVLAGWEKLGLAEVKKREAARLEAEFRGKPAAGRLRRASGKLGDVEIDFIQPAAGANAYSEFLRQHGDGIMSLIYAAPDAEAWRGETERLKAAGAQALQREAWRGEAGETACVYFDTGQQGKYVLGLMHGPGVAAAAPPPAARRITQYAFVIRELRPVSDYWGKLGFPAITTTRPAIRDLQYRGKPVRYEQELGWQRHGAVPFEWCAPPKELPGVYGEFLGRHGEGLQHIAFAASDMDQAIAEWSKLGFPVAQSGAWGEANKPGSGRFAYLDTEPIGGVTVELLWSYK